MSQNRTVHITVNHSRQDVEFTRIYALEAEDLKVVARKYGKNSIGPKEDNEYLGTDLETEGGVLDSPTDDTPAYIERYASGVSVEIHYCLGKKHRVNGPAEVTRRPDGSIEEYYYRQGRLHREDGPAVVQQNPDGSISQEIYYRRGKPHRENGPALFCRLGSGATKEHYYQDDQLHRLDGPAIIERNWDASVACEEYYLHGRPLPKDQYLAERGAPSLDRGHCRSRQQTQCASQLPRSFL